jgi:hypothetical protein
LTRSFITKAAFAATVAVLSVVPAAAKAQFVLNIDGGVSIRDPQASPTNPTTTGTLILDFTNPTSTGSTLGTGTVSLTAGALNTLPGLTAGQTGTIMDLAATTTGFTGLPMSNFLVIGGYNFTLASASGTGVNLPTSGTPVNQTGNFGPIFLTQDAGGVTATFTGSGTVFGGAFGTVGSAFNARFTSQFVNAPGQTPFTIASIAQQIATNPAGLPNNSFSATFQIAAAPMNVIPEPSTYALMVSGVAMIGGLAYRRRQQA